MLKKTVIALSVVVLADCARANHEPIAPSDEAPKLPPRGPARVDACRELYNKELKKCDVDRAKCFENPGKEKLYDPLDKLTEDDEHFLLAQACDGHAATCRGAAFKRLETCVPPL